MLPVARCCADGRISLTVFWILDTAAAHADESCGEEENGLLEGRDGEYDHDCLVVEQRAQMKADVDRFEGVCGSSDGECRRRIFEVGGNQNRASYEQFGWSGSYGT